MSAVEIDDESGRRLWSAAARPQLGCPDDMALAAYVDRRADDATEAGVETALAGCREASCLCLAAIAAARQPAFETVKPETLAAARALVERRPLQRVGRLAQWGAAAAAVLLAAQLGFNLGMASVANDETTTTTWADWSTPADL